MMHLTVETEAAIIGEEITDERGVRFFDHELTTEEHAITKHCPGVSRDYRRHGGTTQQQLANENLHNAPPWPWLRSRSSSKGL